MRFPRDERGVTAIEYCMIASMISIVIVTAVTTIGEIVKGFFLAVMGGFF